MLAVEETELDVPHARDRAMLLARLASGRYTTCLPAVYADAPFYFLIGCLHVNFR